MALRPEDLPAHIRAQLPAASTARRRGKGGGTVRGGKWRCAGCGEPFTVWARAERHGDTPGHHRIECVLEQAS